MLQSLPIYGGCSILSTRSSRVPYGILFIHRSYWRFKKTVKKNARVMHKLLCKAGWFMIFMKFRTIYCGTSSLLYYSQGIYFNTRSLAWPYGDAGAPKGKLWPQSRRVWRKNSRMLVVELFVSHKNSYITRNGIVNAYLTRVNETVALWESLVVQ